jgi:DNA-binding transcriptional regulator YiaG
MNVYTLTLSVAWADQDIEIIQHLAQFLRDRGVFGNIVKFIRGQSVYYELEVSEGHNAHLALKEMLPHLDKKWSQVKGAADYLENRITADEFIAVLNEAFRTKKRSSSIITREMPYMKRQRQSLRGGKPHNRALTKEQVETIESVREDLGLSYPELAKIYNVTASTMFRSLKKYIWTDQN